MNSVSVPLDDPDSGCQEGLVAEVCRGRPESLAHEERSDERTGADANGREYPATGQKMALPHLKYFLISPRAASSARACSMV